MDPQKIDKVALLSQCPLFSVLSQWELKSISQLMRLVEYKKDDVVYREGHQGDAFYVVASGRLEVSVGPDRKKVLAYLKRGDYFGEMSLLTHEPHSATLRVLSDSLLLELKKEDFEKTIASNASISLEISRRLTARLMHHDSGSRMLLKSDVVSIYSNQHRIGRTEFAMNLAAMLFRETHQKTILLDMSPSGQEISLRLQMTQKIPITQFHDIENLPADALMQFTTQHPVGFEVLNVSHKKDDPVGTNIITPLLNHLAINYRYILIDLPEEMDETVFKALSQSDSIYCVTDSHMNNVTEMREVALDLEKNLSVSEEKISIVIHEVLMGVRTTVATKKELFAKKHCYSLPQVPDLEQRERQSLSPYVVEEPDAEYSRMVRHIARRISNNLIGLALGSGAAFGLAHVGVLKVLEREKIEVDIISGSSIGSIVSSLYAVGKSVAEIEKIALDIHNKFQFAKLLDFNLFPTRGLIPGKLIHKHINKQLEHKTFEETRIPLKIVSANLSSRQMLVYESGLIADAVRASISIPAIFDPVRYKTDWIVDGGILSPLPIRALREAGANKVIAVNVFPTPKDTLERRIMEAELGRKEEELVRKRNVFVRLARHIRKSAGRRVLPSIFDVLVNTIQAMEYEISEIEGVQADIVLRPVVPMASWMDFYKPAVFIRRGEEETTKEMSKIKALVSQQNN